jgi:hypothetical protein
MLWIRKNLRAIPVHINSPDIAAVRIEFRTRTVFLAAVYVPPRRQSESTSEQDLSSRIELLRQGILAQREKSKTELEIIIAGDFNRHDQLWGGNEVATDARQGEAEPLTLFIQDISLQSVLPRGTITWRQDRRKSTIDLILASRRLTQDRR